MEQGTADTDDTASAGVELEASVDLLGSLIEGDDPAAPPPGRIKRRVEAMRLKAEAVRGDLEGRRADTRYINIGFLTIERDLSTGGTILAGAIAFRIFMFIVPFVFVGVFAFGLGADAANQDPTTVARRSGIVGLAASSMEAAAELSTWTRVVTLTLASWALLSGAKTMFKSLRAVHALIWRVPLVKARHAMRSAFATIAVTLALVASERLVWHVQQTSVALWVIALALVTAIPTGVWLWLTTNVLPSAAGTTWRDMLPGALFMGLGTQGLHIVTVVWIARSIESKSETYGALGAALTILLWAFLLGRLVTASATLSVVLWEDKQRRLPAASGPSS